MLWIVTSLITDRALFSTIFLLHLIQADVAPFDPPTPKTSPYRTKHEIDRMTRCGDIAIQNFTK